MIDQTLAARLAALAAYNIMDTEPEEGFDDIVFLATQLCKTPVSLVSLVEADRQWFKARIGFPACETPLNQSVCAHALREDEILIIEDLRLDSRTSGNTLVTEDPHIRFYAGAVLKSREGIPVGTLCVIDTVPRPEGLTDEQRQGLMALGRMVVANLELRRAIEHRDQAIVESAEHDRAFRADQHLLRDELNHRLKNILAIVQSLVSQTMRSTDDFDVARRVIGDRIGALASAQDVLLDNNVEGAALDGVVTAAILPHDPHGRVSIVGEKMDLGPKAALMFALTLHELATNAVKYGALSEPNGQVEISWTVNDAQFTFAWQERNGPIVTAPSRRGFGSRLIERVLASEVGGEASLHYHPEGLVYRLSAPISGAILGA